MSTTPTGRHRTRSEGEAVEFTRTYRAGIDDVWSAVTESDRLARWIGFYAGDPQQGFVDFTMNAEGEENLVPVRYEIRRCEPPHVLRVSSTDDVGTWDLIVELTASDGLVTLTFSQIIDDPMTIENTGPGWEYYLDRLSAVMTGADVDALDFDDYYPAQRQHYLAVQRSVTGGG